MAFANHFLASLEADDLDNDVCADFAHGDLERLALV